MKKMLFMSLLLVLALSVSIPAAVSAADPPQTMSIVSDANVLVIGVYNKAGGVTHYVNTQSPEKYAKIAAEPYSYMTNAADSVWDAGTGNYFQTANPVAEWIWETERVEDPMGYSSGNQLLDPDVSTNGRVVVFQKTFFIPGNPQSGELHIAADNCYEVWVNDNHLKRSATAQVDEWETSDLHQDKVMTSGWGEVGDVIVPVAYLTANDNNTITIIAGNEYYGAADGQGTAYVADPYNQGNPGALIFKLDIGYEETPPGNPAPELPAGGLLGLGLAVLAGFGWFGYRRSHAIKA